MPWQQYVADVGLEVDDDGRFAYSLVLATVPRQSGKTTLFGGVLDHRALTTSRARCYFTMQTQKDAVDWLTNEHWPMLAPLGARVSLRRQAGSEHVRYNLSGGLIRPFPPSPKGLHSKTSDLVVVDECWSFDELRGQQLDQAIVPTQATRPNAQVWKVSTAGDSTSTWWEASVERGRLAVAQDRLEGVAYFEWSCPDELDPTDPSSWPQYHPAYGRTIHEPSMRAALDMLGPDDFARAYGNRWVSIIARVIPIGAWRAASVESSPMPTAGRVALGLDVALDRSDGAIVAAWRDDAGRGHCEVADYRPGVSWIPDRVAELCQRWRPVGLAYDGGGPALDVADVIARGGHSIDPLGARDYAAACAGFLEQVLADPPALVIRSHPALDLAAGGAGRRPWADAWAWGRRQSGTSIAPLVAATVALWSYDHSGVDLGPFRIL